MTGGVVVDGFVEVDVVEVEVDGVDVVVDTEDVVLPGLVYVVVVDEVEVVDDVVDFDVVVVVSVHVVVVVDVVYVGFVVVVGSPLASGERHPGRSFGHHAAAQTRSSPEAAASGPAP